MNSYQFNFNQPIPFKIKFGLVLGIVISLVILAIFAFTFFLIAFSGGIIFFVLNFFRPKRKGKFNLPKEYQKRTYQNPSDKDIIDI